MFTLLPFVSFSYRFLKSCIVSTSRSRGALLRYVQTNGGRREQGFTLIELLVVIAIIGILAALVIVPFHNVRVKARNASIRKDVDQMRVIAENVLDDNGSVAYCGAGLICADADPRMAPLKQHADRENGNQGGEPLLFAGATFCAEAILADGTSYCADSNGAYSGPITGAGAGQCVSGVCQ